MSKCKKKLKDELFTLYAKNLSIYSPEFSDTFLCPICLKMFDRNELDKLACAHVFPEKLGGRLLTLSCSECDNKIGSEFNWHAVEEKKVRTWVKEPKYARFIPQNGQIANIMSEWDLEKSTISIYPPKGMPKDVWYRWINEIRGNSSDGGPYKFSIEMKQPAFIPTKRDISYIHSAFLMIFYQFGYEYILSPNADIMRQMFNGNDLSWKPSKLVRPLNKAPESQKQHLDYPLIGIVIEPKELCSFAVFLPSLNAGDSANVVYLPGINENFYNLYGYLERSQTPNQEMTAIYPTQITNESSTIRCNIDICDPRSKGCADRLYQQFTKMSKSDLLNLRVSIKISDRSIQSIDAD